MIIKKVILILNILFFVVMSLYSQEEMSFYDKAFPPTLITIYKDKIVISNEDVPGLKSKEYPRELFYLDDNGFYHLGINGDFIVIIENNSVSEFIYSPEKQVQVTDSTYNDWINWYKKTIEENNAYYKVSRFNTVYTASSELKEGATLYSAKNLGTLFLPPDCREGIRMWNPGHKPWVEGVAGYGENEFITISTSKEFNELDVLNGYVAIERLDLYKKNSRVKDIEIIDSDNNIKYSFTLTDEVRFQNLKMSQGTKNVKLVIKSVYKGDKWDDTCITSIIPKLAY